MYSIRNSRRACLALGVILAAALWGGCSSRAADGISGTYEAKDPEQGGMSLQFSAGHKVNVTVYDPPNDQMTAEGKYEIDGDRITVRVPTSEEPLLLTRKEGGLEMAIPGQNLTMMLTKR